MNPGLAGVLIGNTKCQKILLNHGAGNEARTRDLNLGKVALYQLSYSRPKQRRNCRAVTPGVKNNALQNPSKALNCAAIPPPSSLRCGPRAAPLKAARCPAIPAKPGAGIE